MEFFLWQWMPILEKEKSCGVWILLDNPNAVCYVDDKYNKKGDLDEIT